MIKIERCVHIGLPVFVGGKKKHRIVLPFEHPVGDVEACRDRDRLYLQIRRDPEKIIPVEFREREYHVEPLHYPSLGKPHQRIPELRNGPSNASALLQRPFGRFRDNIVGVQDIGMRRLFTKSAASTHSTCTMS